MTGPLKMRVEFSNVEACSWFFGISTDRDLRQIIQHLHFT